jgi:hypothetical protein
MTVFVMLPACSEDKYEFDSTMSLPTTVTLYNPLTDKAVWMKEIPVNHKLVLDFDAEGDDAPFEVDSHPATLLSWEVYEYGSQTPVESNEMDLSGAPVLIKVSYRSAPEYPSGYRESAEIASPPAPAATYTPAASTGGEEVGVHEVPAEASTPAGDAPGSDSGDPAASPDLDVPDPTVD